MKYNSIREYFYKMYSLLYAIILTPLLVFVVLYWLIIEEELRGAFYMDDATTQILLMLLGGVVVMDWIGSLIVFNRGVSSIISVPSLGDRLDKYYRYTLVRFSIVATGTLCLAVGFYLTEDQMFTVISGGSMLLLLAFWPFPSKVCRDLKLKGDERTLVLYKKDRL
jgi:hypothetical protein